MASWCRGGFPRKRDRSEVDAVYGKDGDPLRSWSLKGRGVEVVVPDGAAACSVRMPGVCQYMKTLVVPTETNLYEVWVWIGRFKSRAPLTSGMSVTSMV